MKHVARTLLQSRLIAWAIKPLQELVDTGLSAIPRHRPSLEALTNAKLIAHRGLGFENKENTIAAFRAVQKAGVWGIEFDVRFTKDGIPVITHDRSLLRVFGIRFNIEKRTFNELYQKQTDVPTLAQIVEEFGGKLHLMIEVKKRRRGLRERESEALRECLQNLEPARDYHFMALQPEILDQIHWVPKKACLTISLVNARSISRRTLAGSYGGHTGYYAFLTRAMQARHQKAGQKIGTGFIPSRGILFRELNRGVEWLFTNRAGALQKILEAERIAASK